MLNYFLQESCRNNFLLPKLSSFSMHFVAAALHQILIGKAKYYSYIIQKSTKPDKNIANMFYNPLFNPRGRGGLVVRSRLWGRKVPGSRPDSTEDPPCMGPVAR
ncbi:hypothetical protein AVEN_68765-1 [Araneus ventricosus]|uniref:Uncharacterized protein n=1 Tax=Araneus ventricosus TaxID=182803 RepID=A0A4Y2C829_ARAVE|nr:hypothetical protein AVEN_68765-1 [Araneus ventricosus]